MELIDWVSIWRFYSGSKGVVESSWLKVCGLEGVSDGVIGISCLTISWLNGVFVSEGSSGVLIVYDF